MKCKATWTSHKIPDDFEDIKTAYLNNISNIIKEHSISPCMVVNFDQTGTKMIPVSDWNLELQGSKQIDIIALDDKREVTTLLAVSLTGELLSPQTILGKNFFTKNIAM